MRRMIPGRNPRTKRVRGATGVDLRCEWQLEPARSGLLKNLPKSAPLRSRLRQRRGGLRRTCRRLQDGGVRVQRHPPSAACCEASPRCGDTGRAGPQVMVGSWPRSRRTGATVLASPSSMAVLLATIGATSAPSRRMRRKAEFIDMAGAMDNMAFNIT
jgi:hypothetical protein